VHHRERAVGSGPPAAAEGVAGLAEYALPARTSEFDGARRAAHRGMAGNLSGCPTRRSGAPCQD
jgi:hypothetical protein